MAIINPYLNFSGNTEEAFNFYRSVFGGEFAVLQRFKDAPDSGKVPDNEKDMIMHVALPISKENVLMGTDALESMGHNITMGTNISLSFSADSKEDADRIFNGLSAGGKIDMPLQDTFWGSYFGMCKDRFGIQWMVSSDKNHQ
jgi:PhnB protein